LQQLCISKIIRAGGDAIVIDSVEKAELLEHWMKTHANADYSEDQMRDMREQA
jgi:anthranilate/para-aminobenzoate synthase component I